VSLAYVAWVAFISEALQGEAQWFTVPLGIAMLVVVAAWRADRRSRGEPVATVQVTILELLAIGLVVGASLVEVFTVGPVRGLVALGAGAAIAAWGALTKVSRRLLAGAGAVLLGVVLMIAGPIARLVPEVKGAVLWVVLGVAGVVLIVVATGLERGRERIAAAVRRVDELMEGWE
jgi:hypothetical protein